MARYYYPHKLNEAMVIVKKEHPIKGASFSYTDDDDELKELVYMIVKWRSETVKKRCHILEDFQINSIANYIVNNKYKVDIRNLILVLSERASDDNFQTVLTDWENKYYSKEIKDYISESAVNGNYLSIWEKHAINTKKMLLWIDTDYSDFPSVIVSNVGTVSAATHYKATLHSMGVIDDTRLFKDCMALFFIVCSREALLLESDQTLAKAYSGYENDNKIQFIIHFLRCLSFVDLYDYKDVYEAISNSMSSKLTKRLFESKLDAEGVLDKYRKWTVLYNLDVSIDDPERAIFWRNYVLSGELIKGNEVMAIVFEDFAITEFKGKAAGPCYFFDVDFFWRAVEPKMLSLTKSAFQSYEHGLYERRSEGLVSKAGDWGRCVHYQPGWKTDFKYYLKKCGVNPTPGLK